jgi:predicted secreted hydrolase
VDAQELVTTRSTGIAYWEGAVQVSGTWQGKPVSGRGYLELTGYSEQHRPKV